MRHNKQELKHKDFIKAEKRLNQVYKLQRALPYKEVANPYQDGWWIIPAVREDFMRSDKGPIVKDLLEKYGRNHVCKDPKKITEIRKNPSLYDARRTLHKGMLYFGDTPSIQILSNRQYEALTEQHKKYFGVSHRDLWNRVGNEYQPSYEINVPSHYLVVKIQKRIITHIKDIDPLLLQEEAELKSILAPYWRNSFYGGNYHYFENKAERRQSKVNVKKLIEEYE